tara:strand:- start:428 stop:733 length:306 start_codon:yes stop_codon:yes gene_type:complete
MKRIFDKLSEDTPIALDDKSSVRIDDNRVVLSTDVLDFCEVIITLDVWTGEITDHLYDTIIAFIELSDSIQEAENRGQLTNEFFEKWVNTRPAENTLPDMD